MPRSAPAVIALVASALLFGTPVVAIDAPHELEHRWRHWRLSAPLRPNDAVPPASDGLARVDLPPSVVRHTASGLSDLRLIDDMGREVPYAVRRDRALSVDELDSLEPGFEPTHDEPGRTNLLIEPDRGVLTASGVQCTTSTDAFHRIVTIDVRHEPTARWRTVTRDALVRRIPVGPHTRPVSISFRPTRAAAWRMRIDDGADRPLENLRCELRSDRPQLIFRADPARHYRLLVDRPRAVDPRYELGRLIPDEIPGRARPYRVGAAALNPGWVDPAPWSERHPWIIWPAVGMVAITLVLIALRALRER